MFCTKCGANNRDGAKFCAQCGAPLSARAVTPPPPPPPPPADPVETTPAELGEPDRPRVDAQTLAPQSLPVDAGDEVQPPETPPDDFPEPASKPAAPARSIKRWYGLAALLVVAIAAAGLWQFRQPAGEIAEISPAASLAEPPIPATEPQAAPPEDAPAAAASEPSPAPVEQAAADPAVKLDEAAIRDLIARLQNGPQPASCRAGAAKLRKDHPLSANQASDIAKRAWPDLCSPPKPAAAPEPQAEADAPAPPAVNSIDQVFKERSASECASGLSGYFCREVLRNKLCTGKWSDSPPPGQSLCYLPPGN